MALLGCALSMAVTCGLVFLVCLGFGIQFSWYLGLGVWAVIALVKTLFGNGLRVKIND